MSAVLFFIAGLGAIAGAIGVVALRNPFYSVLALVSHLISLALLFLLLNAEFVAASQVVVYAGAVMVLYVFVVSYVGGDQEPVTATGSRGGSRLAFLFAGALFIELFIAIVGSGLKAIDSRGAGFNPPPGGGSFGSPEELGRLLLTDFLLPFEVASFLLLIAAVGAVTLARRRGGLETDEELSLLTPMDFARPIWTGTMQEGVGDHPRAASTEETR